MMAVVTAGLHLAPLLCQLSHNANTQKLSNLVAQLAARPSHFSFLESADVDALLRSPREGILMACVLMTHLLPGWHTLVAQQDVASEHSGCEAMSFRHLNATICTISCLAWIAKAERCCRPALGGDPVRERLVTGQHGCQRDWFCLCMFSKT